jgi:hypothetical protein
MNPSNVAPTVCPQCGHRFPPGAPEPSCCPDCRLLCTGYGESEEIQLPLPDAMPVTAGERAWWRTWSWAFFFIGPLFAVVLALFKRDILSSLPAALRPFVEANSHPLLPLCLSAAGAGFCLAKLWFTRRRFGDILAYAFLISFVVMVLYGAIFLAGNAIVLAVFSKPIN